MCIEEAVREKKDGCLEEIWVFARSGWLKIQAYPDFKFYDKNL